MSIHKDRLEPSQKVLIGMFALSSVILGTMIAISIIAKMGIVPGLPVSQLPQNTTSTAGFGEQLLNFTSSALHSK